MMFGGIAAQDHSDPLTWLSGHSFIATPIVQVVSAVRTEKRTASQPHNF